MRLRFTAGPACRFVQTTHWFRLATVLEEVTANESQRSLLGRAVPATNHIAPLEALNKLLRQLKPKLATRKLHCCRRSVKDVCVGNGGHKKVHKHLLPPLVASLDGILGVVLVGRIDSPHILSVVFDCGRLLEFGVTTALLHYSRRCMDVRQQADRTLVVPANNQHLFATKKQRRNAQHLRFPRGHKLLQRSREASSVRPHSAARTDSSALKGQCRGDAGKKIISKNHMASW